MGDDENWENGEGPVMEDVVVIDKGLNVVVDEDVSCSMLVLLDSANVSIKNGHNFYVSSDIIYSKNLSLQYGNICCQRDGTIFLLL